MRMVLIQWLCLFFTAITWALLLWAFILTLIVSWQQALTHWYVWGSIFGFWGWITWINREDFRVLWKRK